MNSTTRQKPDKPRSDFPLYPHASGKWGEDNPRQDVLLWIMG